MRIILYMAMTTNGFIADKNDDTSFVSQTEWRSFRAMIRRIGNMVVGHRTYAIMQRDGDLHGLESIRVIILTRTGAFRSDYPRHTAARSPGTALRTLELEGFRNVLIAGGGITNASFAKQKSIDELFLDIEPATIGDGIPLFRGSNFEMRLRLLGIKRLSRDRLQLHYRVVKK
mgnify:CR=1 FL=1